MSPVSPEGRRLLFAGLSAVGYALTAEALLLHGILGSGGAGGGDVFAYWTSGRHVIDGEPLYGPGVGGYAAFLYPPPLAQLFAILAWLPFPVVVWGWRMVELGCVRIAVGSWRRVGIALLAWPPIIAELDAGNVHLLVAAAVAMMIRGDSRFLVPAALTKFASLAALPAGLRRDPGGLARGVVIAGGIVLVSFTLSPNLWYQYATFLPSVSGGDSGWYNLGAFVPLWLRLAVAAAFALAAVRWVRLSAIAATLAFPVLWFHGLSALVALAAPRKASAVEPADGR